MNKGDDVLRCWNSLLSGGKGDIWMDADSDSDGSRSTGMAHQPDCDSGDEPSDNHGGDIELGFELEWRKEMNLKVLSISKQV